MTTDIKIKEELWNLIVSGKKTTEFRKLCKGLDTGTYRFVSIERDMTMEICGYCYGCDMGWKCEHITPRDVPVKIFGTAILTPIAVNPPFSNTDAWNDNKLLDGSMYFCSSNYARWNNICDKESYKFLKEHYIDEHDFVAYNITDVKDLRNE